MLRGEIGMYSVITVSTCLENPLITRSPLGVAISVRYTRDSVAARTVGRYLRLAKPAISTTGIEEGEAPKPAISITWKQAGEDESKPAISIAGITAGRRSYCEPLAEAIAAIRRFICLDRVHTRMFIKIFIFVI